MLSGRVKNMGTLIDIILKVMLLGFVAIIAMIAGLVGYALLSFKHIMFGLGVLIVGFLICRLIIMEDFSKDTKDTAGGTHFHAGDTVWRGYLLRPLFLILSACTRACHFAHKPTFRSG